MVPETKAKGEIRLYECEDFPLKWKFKKTIFSSINATDTMIFEHNGLWWMLTTFSNCGKFNDSELHVFYSKEGPITKNGRDKSKSVIIDPELEEMVEFTLIKIKFLELPSLLVLILMEKN